MSPLLEKLTIPIRRAILLVLLFFFAGLLILSWAYEAWCTDRIYPGIRVWGLTIGGMEPSYAAAVLEEQLGNQEHSPVTLRGPDRSWGVRPADLGIQIIAETTAHAAFQVGRQKGEGFLSHLMLLLGGHDLSPTFTYDETITRLYLETLADLVAQPPVDATLTLQGTLPVASASQPGRTLDVEMTLAAVQNALADLGAVPIDLIMQPVSPQVVDAEPARAQAEALLSQPLLLLLPNPREGDPGPWSLSPQELAPMLSTLVQDNALRLTLDQNQLRAYLEGLAPTLAIEPVNARFHFDEASGYLEAIAPSTEGRALDIESSLQNILTATDAGQHLAPLTLSVIPPRYTAASTAEEMGIRTLVAEGDSYFIGSPSGRDRNIRLATSQFDGIVIPPGETFSFNHFLGEVTAKAGYDESLISGGEQYAMGIGGGICQVSTTVFRAALWGGYPITERWYHYQRVGYYELQGYGPGFDATVYSPQVDFKFTNDRSTALLIEAEIEEEAHRLIFVFYSTDDYRQVTVEGAEITDETEPGPPIYELDEELEPETVIRWQSESEGLTATVERWVYDASGALLMHNTYVSRYAPRRAAYHYGPGYEPPEE